MYSSVLLTAQLLSTWNQDRNRPWVFTPMAFMVHQLPNTEFPLQRYSNHHLLILANQTTSCGIFRGGFTKEFWAFSGKERTLQSFSSKKGGAADLPHGVIPQGAHCWGVNLLFSQPALPTCTHDGEWGKKCPALPHSELQCGFLVFLQGKGKWLWYLPNPVRGCLESGGLFDMDSPPRSFSFCCCALSLFRKHFTQ